jgi:hypothetical protein
MMTKNRALPGVTIRSGILSSPRARSARPGAEACRGKVAARRARPEPMSCKKSSTGSDGSKSASSKGCPSKKSGWMNRRREGEIASESDVLAVHEELLEKTSHELGKLLVESQWLVREKTRAPTELDRRGSLPSWANADDLAEMGWGVIFPSEQAGELRRRLAPLLQLRQSQARHRYQEWEVGRNDLARKFLAQRRVVPGAMVDPERLPYYLLIVGDPTLISYKFQYHLNIHRAVGRLAFADLDDYDRYAASVAEVEQGGAGVPRRATLFAVDNGDRATQRLTEHLVRPLAARLPRHAPDWSVEVWEGDQASKEALGGLFKETPAFLLAASHGLRMKPGSDQQLARQGALVCQDWPGSGPCYPHQYFQAEDLPRTVRLQGLIALFAACYGAGTPQEDNFPHEETPTRQTYKPLPLAAAPFVARLPQALLRQGALAVVGHVDRMWTTSFCWQANGKSQEAMLYLEDTLKKLLEGQRIGHALRPLAERSSRLAEELSEPLKSLHENCKVDLGNLADLWTSHNDARNMILLGDPAVKNAVAQ